MSTETEPCRDGEMEALVERGLKLMLEDFREAFWESARTGKTAKGKHGLVSVTLTDRNMIEKLRAITTELPELLQYLTPEERAELSNLLLS